MGGFTVAAMLGMAGAMAFAILGAVCAALAMFVAATVVSIVFACRTKTRRQQGKRLKGLIAVPVVLYGISIPVLVWFALTWAVPLTTDVEGDEYSDFSAAIANHDPDALQACLDARAFSFADEGPQSLPALFMHAVNAGDAACAEEVLKAAADAGTPLDVNAPLGRYADDGTPYDEEYPLVRAAESCSTDMSPLVSALLAAGANPNVASLQDPDGRTPLHSACDSIGWIGSSSNADLLLDGAGESIEALLSYGADPEARDESGRTAGELLAGNLEGLVEENVITREEAQGFTMRYAAKLMLAP